MSAIDTNNNNSNGGTANTDITEEELKVFIDSLKLTFPHKYELEYHEFIQKGSLNNPVIPLIVISVDRMLTTEERALIPSTYNNKVRIQMEYVMTLDPNDEAVKKEIENASMADSASADIHMDEGEDDSYDEDDEDIEDNQNKQ